MSARAALLADVCDISMGQAPSGDTYNAEGSGLPLIAGAGDFGDLTPEPKKFTTSPTKVSRPGDLILCIRATIGDRNWADREYCLGRGVAGLSGRPYKLDQKYLWHWLGYATPKLKAKGRGATFLQVNKADIGSMEISLPPIPEQRRIAAILDKADVLRAKRREAVAKLDQLLQSVFLDMFGDPASNPKRWPEAPLGELTTKIGSGATPKGGGESYVASGISLVRSMNVHDGVFRWDKLAFITEAQADKLRNVKVEADDVLLNITGASVARVCRAPASALPARVNQHVSIIRCGETIVPQYLEHLLMSHSMKSRLLSVGESGATRQAITKAEIAAFLVPVPSRDLQEKFAAIVHRIEVQVTSMQLHLARQDRLFASLQHRAFAGTL